MPRTLCLLVLAACVTQNIEIRGGPARITRVGVGGAQPFAARAGPGPVSLPTGYWAAVAYEFTFEHGERACLRPQLNPLAVLWPLGPITGSFGWTGRWRYTPHVSAANAQPNGCAGVVTADEL